LLQPQGLALDASGALYVADGCARVLYYPTPNGGFPASKVLGVIPTPTQGQPTFPNDSSLGNSIANTPLAVFTNGNAVFVADTVANRVVRYDSAAQYNPTDTAPSPRIQSVVGQADLVSGKTNRGMTEPDATSLSLPQGGAFDSVGNLWVADTGNNRVLSYPANGALSYTSANIVVGQTDFPFSAPNLIEGKELWIYNGSVGGGIVVDKTSDPPRLYISDTFNNRVLGFRDARAVGTDSPPAIYSGRW
jgi:sugar lactone lactonase YvrE